MKRVIYYLAIFISVVLLLPLLVVKGCEPAYKPPEVVEEGKTNLVKVYIKDEDRVEEMALDEYLKGVIAAEMPAEFDMEALKAQAVAARSYTYIRLINGNMEKSEQHKGATICTDSKCCQAWVSKNAALKKWGILSSYFYWNKIVNAVNATSQQILTYEGTPISPLYHANSGGRTENGDEVWQGKAQPYHVSVTSKGEEKAKDFTSYIDITKKSFIELLKNKYETVKLEETDLSDSLKILEYTAGGRVRFIQVGTLTLRGTEFREIFTLKSANFKIKDKDKNTLRITTTGYGHGVGMSQRGADCMAKDGSTYEEILKHYYAGVKITTLNSLQ